MVVFFAQELIDIKLYHEIHISEIREFQKCEQSWQWKYNDRYYPLSKAKPLEFGTAYHAGMAAFFDPELPYIQAKGLNAFLGVNHEQKVQALSRTTDEEEIEQIKKDFDARATLGAGMLVYYFNEVHPKEDAFLTPKFTEVTFATQISSLWCECYRCKKKIDDAYENGTITEEEYNSLSRLPICAEGTIDIIFEHKNGHLVFGDWKTTSTLKDRHEWLHLDIQLKMYWWALRELGYNIREAFYNETLKAYPTMLNQLDKPRSGRMFSVDKTQVTNYDLAKLTVATYDKEAYLEGLYDAFLDWLRDNNPKTTQRTYAYYTDEELNIFGKYLEDVAARMIAAKRDNLMISPTSYNCGYCEFLQPCIEKQSAQEYQHILDSNYRIEKPYYDKDE